MKLKFKQVKIMNKIIIRNRFDDSVILEHECENNTIKITVEKAVKEGANLRGANLEGANLEGAHLEGANLICANLRGANLEGANNKELAYLPIFCKWSHSIKGDKIQIGCKEKTLEEWINFFENSTESYSTERDTQDFKQIKAVFYSYKSYLDILNS